MDYVEKESMARKNALPATSGPWSRELLKEIAMGIAKETVAHIELMYPAALIAAPSTFPFFRAQQDLQRDHGGHRSE